MKKVERNKLRKRASEAIHFVTLTKEQLVSLLDYVDTLEAACKRAAGIAVVMSHSAEREIYMILSEALDKGK